MGFRILCTEGDLRARAGSDCKSRGALVVRDLVDVLFVEDADMERARLSCCRWICEAQDREAEWLWWSVARRESIV